MADPRPLVLLIDEIDTLIGDSLISVLRQLRAGNDLRPGSFPQSVVLCGVRDVRDYRIRSGSGNTAVTGGSALPGTSGTSCCMRPGKPARPRSCLRSRAC